MENLVWTSLSLLSVYGLLEAGSEHLDLFFLFRLEMVEGVLHAEWTLASEGPLPRALEPAMEDRLSRLSSLRVTSTLEMSVAPALGVAVSIHVATSTPDKLGADSRGGFGGGWHGGVGWGSIDTKHPRHTRAA